MLLAIDIGNTNIHLGLWQDDAWKLSWRARTVIDKMPDEYAVLLRNYLNGADVGFRVITGVVLSSVVPPLTPVFVELIERYTDCTPVVVSSNVNTCVEIAIDQPQQALSGRFGISVSACRSSLKGGCVMTPPDVAMRVSRAHAGRSGLSR